MEVDDELGNEGMIDEPSQQAHPLTQALQLLFEYRTYFRTTDFWLKTKKLF